MFKKLHVYVKDREKKRGVVKVGQGESKSKRV